MKVHYRFFHIALIVLLLTSCGNNPAKSSSNGSVKSDSTATAKGPAPINTDAHNKYNEIALYLAGMKSDSFSSVPAKFLNLPGYKKYCDTMTIGFNIIEKNRLSKMRDWAKVEMAPELASPKTVLYPFSGPDILHCVQFFPDADQYIMVALERYGSLPVFEKLDSLKALVMLDYVRVSLEDIFDKSYFITRKMAVTVSNQYNGFIPLASVFLVRSGYTILDIRYKHLLDDGKTFVEIPQDTMGKYLNDCVEIYFRKNGGSKIQKLAYYRTNLCDNVFATPGLKDNKGFRTYLDSLPEVYTYAKSASYLMSQSDFNIIRNICLTKSKTILQDDTGVGFAYYDPKKWTIKLFGSYTRPIEDFHGGYYQSNLEQAYKADPSHVKQLPFSLGYHWKDQVQNLMKFEKK